MAGLRQFLGGTGLVILFGIASFMFMTGFLEENNPSFGISNDTFVNSSSNALQNRANELKNLGESSKNILTSYQPSVVYLFLIIYSAFAIPLNFLAFLIKSIGTILIVLWQSIFGIGNSDFDIAFGLLSGIILLTIVLLILRAIRTGETER